MLNNTPLRKQRIQRINEARYKRDVEHKSKMITNNKKVVKKAYVSPKAIYISNKSIGKKNDVKKDFSFSKLIFVMFVFVVMFGTVLNGLMKYQDNFDYDKNSIEEIMLSFQDVEVMNNISSYFVNGVKTSFNYIKTVGDFGQLVIDTVNAVYAFVTGQVVKDFVEWNWLNSIGRYFDFNKYFRWWS